MYIFKYKLLLMHFLGFTAWSNTKQNWKIHAYYIHGMGQPSLQSWVLSRVQTVGQEFLPWWLHPDLCTLVLCIKLNISKLLKCTQFQTTPLWLLRSPSVTACKTLPGFTNLCSQIDNLKMSCYKKYIYWRKICRFQKHFVKMQED